MSFVMCIKGKPPPDIEFGRIIDDWCYVDVTDLRADNASFE